MATAASDDGIWTRRFHQSASSGPRLVLFPHAGGSASYFFPFSRGFSPDIETLAVQYPGRQDRRAEACLEDIGQLADEIANRLVRYTGSGRPLALFGHSMGAFVAFEVARRLEDGAAAPVARLFASGARAPSVDHDDGVRQRDDEGVLAELTRLNGTGTKFLRDPEIVQMLLPPLRADFTAIETYRVAPDEALRCPITIVVGDHDPRVTVAQARAWADHTSGGSDLRVFPGGHFYLDEHRDDVIRLVTSYLVPDAPFRSPQPDHDRG